jgi:hypothetical protein
MSTEVLELKLDRMIALYELVNSAELESARSALRADPITRSILDVCEEWTSSGAVKSELAKSLVVSEKTVQRRILELAGKAALTSRRDGNNVLYKTTGVV